MTIDKPYQLCISSNIIIALIILFQRRNAGKKLQVAEDQELEDCLLEIAYLHLLQQSNIFMSCLSIHSK